MDALSEDERCTLLLSKMQEFQGCFSALETLAEVSLFISSQPSSPYSLSPAATSSSEEAWDLSISSDEATTASDNHEIINFESYNIVNNNNKRAYNSNFAHQEKPEKKAKVNSPNQDNLQKKAAQKKDHSDKDNRRENSVTVSRKCLVEGCDHFFPDRAALDDHLLAVHRIKHYRCQVAGCGVSYSTQ